MGVSIVGDVLCQWRDVIDDEAGSHFTAFELDVHYVYKTVDHTGSQFFSPINSFSPSVSLS
jgi:hypothetical protein